MDGLERIDSREEANSSWSTSSAFERSKHLSQTSQALSNIPIQKLNRETAQPLSCRRPSLQRSVASRSLRHKSSCSSNSLSPGSIPGTDYLSTKPLLESPSSGLSSPWPTGQFQDPPRSAKEGFEWVWFPQGYWAEREIVERPPSRRSRLREIWLQRSQRSTISLSETTDPGLPQLHLVPAADISSQPRDIHPDAILGTKSSVDEIEEEKPHVLSIFKRGLQRMSPSIMSPLSNLNIELPETSSESGLDRVKRSLNLKFRKEEKTSSAPEGKGRQITPSISSTSMTLIEATECLHQLRKPPTLGLGNLGKAGCHDSKRTFGKAPWHRKTSHDSILSATSSVRNLLMGKTPNATPEPEATYLDSMGKKRLKMDLPILDQLEFLPSEATPVKTPLLSPRLGEMDHPATTTLVKASCGSSAHEMKSMSRDSRSGGEWPYFDEEESPTPSDSPWADIPDHLPSSPLCPQNPKHPSGGAGICPMHRKLLS